ncbi:MAG: PAS domain S-box protein [Flavobacteriales bacterium]|nr:PAS domain S-box protein [Flavobacteriales bacterium]
MNRYIDKKDALKEGAGQLLFDTAAEGLMLVNGEGEILIVNQQLEDMFGYKGNELIGEKIEALVPQRIRKQHVGHRDAYHANPHKRSMGKGMDLLAVKKDGEEFPVEISLNYMRNEEGDLVVMALVTDISDRKRAEIALQDLSASLREGRIEARFALRRANV